MACFLTADGPERWMRRCLYLIGAVFAGTGWSQESPQAAYCIPPVLRAGGTQEVVVHGRDLHKVTGLLADMPVESRLLGQDSTSATFRVTVPGSVWLGIHQIRLVGADSVSAPRLVLIDELAAVRQADGNQLPSQRKASPSRPPSTATRRPARWTIIVSGSMAPAALTFEVIARRLGTGPDVKLGGDEAGRLVNIDPVLRLLDARGGELVCVDDTPGLTSDLRFRHHFQQAGEYGIAIHDVQYRGGPEHQYVLRVGDFPDVQVCYPLGGPSQGCDHSLKLYPSDRDEGFAPASVSASGVRLDRVDWISARTCRGLRSLAVPYLGGQPHGVKEVEPNDDADRGNPVRLPGACDGRLQTPGDVDSFALELGKGQQVRVTTIARTMGSTIWPAVRVLGTKGEQVAATVIDLKAVPNGSVSDPRLDPPPVTFSAAADGRHTIQVRRRLGRAGPAAVYRLEVEPYAGSFAVRPVSDSLAVPRGTAVLGVDVSRDGYAGPVGVTAFSAERRVVASTSRVPGSHVGRALVTISVPEDFPMGAVWIGVEGQATIGGREVHRVADLTSFYDAPAGLLPHQGPFFFLRPLPAVILHRLPVVVTTPAPFTLNAPGKLAATKQGSTIAVAIHCCRAGGDDAPVALRLEGLPGTSAPTATVANGKTDATISLKIPDKLQRGKYTFVVVGESAAQGRKWTNATPCRSWKSIRERSVSRKERLMMRGHECEGFRDTRPTRRHLLRIGALGFLGFDLATFFRVRSAQASGPPASKVESCIFLYYYGGPSHLETWDMKPEAPREVRGDFRPIATKVPGLIISEHLRHSARVVDKLAIIRGMHHGMSNHNAAAVEALCGRTPLKGDLEFLAGDPTDFPCYGSALTYLLPSNYTVPPHVALPHVMRNVVKLAGQTAGFLGSAYDPMQVAQDPNAPDFRIGEMRLPDDLSLAELEHRQSLQRAPRPAGAGLGRGSRRGARDGYLRKGLPVAALSRRHEGL